MSWYSTQPGQGHLQPPPDQPAQPPSEPPPLPPRIVTATGQTAGQAPVWDGSSWQPQATLAYTGTPAANQGLLWNGTGWQTAAVLTEIGAAVGPPTTGAWVQGQTYADANNAIYICTSSGTPGTWAAAALPDSGWQNATLENGFANYGAPYTDVRYRKIGNQVFVDGALSIGTATSGSAAFVLPAGYYPDSGSDLVLPLSTRNGTTSGVTGPASVQINQGYNGNFTISWYDSDSAPTLVATNCNFLVD